MNNTHTLEDSLEEGEARKIAMLGQNEDVHQESLAHALLSTPIHIRTGILVISIFITAISLGILQVVAGGSIIFLLTGALFINDDFIDFDVSNQPIQALWTFSALIIGFVGYRSARRSYARGTRRAGVIVRETLIETLKNPLVSLIIILASIVMALALVKLFILFAVPNFSLHIDR